MKSQFSHLMRNHKYHIGIFCRFERENKKLLSDNLRLDTENDNLARQLVNSKIEMRKDIDKIEDEKDYFEKEFTSAKSLLSETQEEKKRLAAENEQLVSLISTFPNF